MADCWQASLGRLLAPHDDCRPLQPCVAAWQDTEREPRATVLRCPNLNVGCWNLQRPLTRAVREIRYYVYILQCVAAWQDIDQGPRATVLRYSNLNVGCWNLQRPLTQAIREIIRHYIYITVCRCMARY